MSVFIVSCLFFHCFLFGLFDCYFRYIWPENVILHAILQIFNNLLLLFSLLSHLVSIVADEYDGNLIPLIIMNEKTKESVLSMTFYIFREFPDKVASMFAMIELFFGIGEL